MNITRGLRRALQVKSCGTATIFEGRRRTWQEIGDRVSRFAGALHAHPLGRGDQSCATNSPLRTIDCPNTNSECRLANA
jgi:acyl-CoA synthetase (AMP-forming)/AMP-acid ligase II